METITQRQLRNDNASVVQAVIDGKSFTVTRRGEPVARLVPIDVPASDKVSPPDTLRLVKPARRRFDSANYRPVAIDRPSGEILDELRAERL